MTERLFRRPIVHLGLAVLLAADAGVTADLRPETLKAWATYRTAVQARRARERRDAARFLALDHLPTRATDRRAALAGEIVVRRLDGDRAGTADVEMPGGRVHHWLGAVLIRNTSIPELLSRIEHADPPAIEEDVMASSVLGRQPGQLRTFLRIRRTKIVTAVYNTEHLVRFEYIDDRRGASESTATRIAEVQNPGTARETELRPGEDRGFLWKLDAFWRYEAAPGGVLAECESISLSRDVPLLLEYVAGPLIERTARESMEKTLRAVRERYTGR